MKFFKYYGESSNSQHRGEVITTTTTRIDYCGRGQMRRDLEREERSSGDTGDEMKAYNFLRSNERIAYDNAPDEVHKMCRTFEEEAAVRLYNQIDDNIAWRQYDRQNIHGNVRILRGVIMHEMRTELQPNYFMTHEENEYYEQAPHEPEYRTFDQACAVQLRTLLREDMNKGLTYEQIGERMSRHRQNVQRWTCDNKRPCHFLSHEENAAYKQVPPNLRERTPEQEFIAQYYNRISNDIEDRLPWNAIKERLPKHRSQVEAESSDHRQDVHAMQLSHFLSDEEKEAYKQAPYEPEYRTFDEACAVRLCTLLREDMNKGLTYKQIKDTVKDHRQKVPPGMRYYPRPCHFLSHEENAAYKQVPPNLRERTPEQEFIAQYYNRIDNDIEDRLTWNAIKQRLAEHRNQVEAEIESERDPRSSARP